MLRCGSMVSTNSAAASQHGFQNSLLIITFAEAEATDYEHGAGTSAVIVSPSAKAGYQSATLYQHEARCG